MISLLIKALSVIAQMRRPSVRRAIILNKFPVIAKRLEEHFMAYLDENTWTMIESKLNAKGHLTHFF